MGLFCVSLLCDAALQFLTVKKASKAGVPNVTGIKKKKKKTYKRHYELISVLEWHTG